MHVSSPILPFAQAVLLGALAGAAPYLLVSVRFALLRLPLAFTDFGEFLGMLLIAAFPLAVSLPIVLGASVVIGLPVTAALRRWDKESAAAYVGLGAAAGTMVAGAISVLVEGPDTPWAAFLGGISGAVTGGTWWRSARKPDLA